MRNVLLIAYHFPPLQGSSGIQRALRFAQHLPENGWEPHVLTVRPSAYECLDLSSVGEIRRPCTVRRVWALDVARHLAIGGRYPAFLARPDRWASWRLPGTLAGLSMCRRHRIDAVWSTYPIATAHVIGADVSRIAALPWVADFRDPMAQEGYPEDSRTWSMFRRIESTAAHRASRLTFTTPGAVRAYQALFNDVDPRKFALIENGFDEESFLGIQLRPRTDSRTVFLHSGIVYPGERDPSSLFQALSRMKLSGTISARNVVFRFRASANDNFLRNLAEKYAVTDLIDICPALSYRDALAEMSSADALLILQAADCNAQIPAKLYEYFRAQRPIVALTDEGGDTCSKLRSWGYRLVAPLEDPDRICSLLESCVKGGLEPPNHTTAEIAHSSRRGKAKELAAILDEALDASRAR